MDRVHQIGATVLVVGLSGAIEFKPQRNQTGSRLQVVSGGSSGVALMQSAGGVTCSQGYILGTQVVEINGPAVFFLAAQGTTALVSQAVLYSAGFSITP